MAVRALHADKLVPVIADMTRDREADRGAISTLILAGVPFETWWKQSLLTSFAADPWRRMPGRFMEPGVEIAINTPWKPIDNRMWPGRTMSASVDRDQEIDIIVRISRSGKRAHLIRTYVLDGRSSSLTAKIEEIEQGAIGLRDLMALRATASAWTVLIAHSFRGASHLRARLMPLVNRVPGLRKPMLCSVARAGGGAHIWVVGMRVMPAHELVDDPRELALMAEGGL